MRRTLAFLPVLGLFGAALGCQHIGGKNDCGAHASDAEIMPPTNPYAFAPVGGATVIPPANGKDVVVPKKDVVDPKKTGNESSGLPTIESEQLPAFKSVPPQN